MDDCYDNNKNDDISEDFFINPNFSILFAHPEALLSQKERHFSSQMNIVTEL